MRKAAAALVLVGFLLSGCQGVERVSGGIEMMDTYCAMTLYGSEQEQLEQALSQAFERSLALEALLSKTAPESDVSKINRADGAFTEIASETAYVIKKGSAFSESSKGSFDITVGAVTALWDFKQGAGTPDEDKLKAALQTVGTSHIQISADNSGVRLFEGAQLDLGAIAKGYVADEAAASLKAAGIQSAILDMGGDVVIIGAHPLKSHWEVGIQKPFGIKNDIVGTLLIEKDAAVITSGVYQRYFEFEGVLYHHILSPYTGYPADNELSSVTVVAANAADGDAVATACMVLGLREGKNYVEGLDGMDAIFITKEGVIYFTSGFNSRTDISFIQ